ncbi:HEAT repeat domain-containing protein [Rhodothermus marinus]|uniref:PBS lyase HEAT domain protein repeat-containing protein n=1 Tax=Rhodothermus marinus (strain ATCC 43812 / DSM 4252 / R-10) TaxID=518766 RepID=D0MFM2_RHOM4|nr:HEAT repeat domain-containing protein [Rhodothermus marinus]ACY47549.1 PBS lyase HEAT domain protein repeat-containing protein [Rhodothermus marinus DSM 4252]
MGRWLSVLTLLLVTAARAQPGPRDEQLLRALETARTPAEARPLLERLGQALKDGELFGEEVRIARLTRRFWEDPAAPPAVRFQLQEIYGMIAPALAAMAPSLAETLFVHGPLGWLQGKDPERRRWALDALTLGWEILYGQNLQEVFLQALPAVLASAATWPEEEFEAVLSLLADRITLSTETHLPDSLPPAFVERLRGYRGPHGWKLPDILALDTTAAGTEQLLAFALDPPPPPPSLAVQRWRELFLEKLERRRLTPEQKRQVVALLADPELRHVVFRLVRAWWYREEPLPPPPPEMLPLLEAWAVRENCEEAVRLLAAAGPEGVKRLFRLVTEDRRDWNAPIRNPRPCEWDRWHALFEQAGEIAEEIEATYRANPAPWHVRLLARAGRWELVLQSLQLPDAALRREAAFVLGLALAPEEDELARTGDAGHGRMLATSLAQRPDLLPRVQEALRETLKDEDLAVRREALRALLWRGDEAARPALLAALRMDEENRFQAFLSGFRPKLTDSLALALARIAREDSSGPVRRRAIDLLTRAQPGSWSKVVEGELRSLLGDPDPEVRRAVAGYFAAVPAQEVATTAALLEATQDSSEYVRHFSAMALGRARGWTPELVARLEARLEAGDPDDNVVRGLEGAYLYALRREPGSVDRLLAIVLDRKGPARWRKALAEGPPADSIVARALLERLAARPVEDWASMPPKFGLEALQRMIEFFVRAEEDPPPLVLIGHLVPREMLDLWLIRRALEDPKLSLEHRLWLIHQTLEIPADLREDVWRLLMQALREEEGGEMTLALLGRWGFAGVRRLVEERWDEPETLRRVARHLLRQEELGRRRAATGSPGGPSLPRPSAEDLPWIEATLARLVPGTRDPRLEPLVGLLGLWELGQYHKRAVFQTRIPQLLLRHLADPVECRAVAEAVGSLFSRGVVPRCR